MSAKMITLLVVAGLLAIVLFQNMQTVTFRLLFWKLEVSQLLLVVITSLCGFIAGVIVGGMRRGSGSAKTSGY